MKPGHLMEDTFMANPPKAKGTRAETELLRLFADDGITLKRTAPGTLWDLEGGPASDQPVEVLATRADRGGWLLTMRYADAVPLLRDRPLRIEVKRYARFSLHRIFESKFGRT